MKTNPAMDGLWKPFNSKAATELRAHRSKFVPDDEFYCDTLAKVVKVAVDNPTEGLPLGTVVTVIQVSPPQISNSPVWRRMRKPYVSALCVVDNVERPCNLECLLPI